MLLLASFLLGIVFGFIATITAAYLTFKHLDKQQSEVDKVKKDIKLIASIKKRFSTVSEITNQQMELLSRTERPSASALHSKHQNGIIGEIKRLEEEKISIFRSILKDGLDPNLSIIIDGKVTTMKMSEAVSLYESNQSPTIKTETKSTRGKLHLVINEDKDVGGSEEDKKN